MSKVMNHKKMKSGKSEWLSKIKTTSHIMKSIYNQHVSLVELNLIRPENGNVTGKEKLLFFSEKENCLARKTIKRSVSFLYCQSLLLSDNHGGKSDAAIAARLASTAFAACFQNCAARQIGRLMSLNFSTRQIAVEAVPWSC